MKSFKYLFIICLMISSNAIVTGQNKIKISQGTIKGVVVDEKTKKPLPGVNIVVEGTTRGTITASDGNFTIKNMPVGNYNLIITYIGYAKKRVKNVTIKPNEVTTVDLVELTEEPIALSEIVVTPGQFSIMGTRMAPRQVLSSEDIKNMSWAEDITRGGCPSPGHILKRLFIEIHYSGRRIQ